MDELPKADREVIEKILMLPVHELNQDQINFLNARRDYLPYSTKVAYKSVLIQDNETQTEEEAVANTQTAQPQTQYTDPNAAQQTTAPEAPANPEGNGQTQEANPYAADPNAAI